jgi:hypothetical protein
MTRAQMVEDAFVCDSLIAHETISVEMGLTLDEKAKLHDLMQHWCMT